MPIPVPLRKVHAGHRLPSRFSQSTSSTEDAIAVDKRSRSAGSDSECVATGGQNIQLDDDKPEQPEQTSARTMTPKMRQSLSRQVLQPRNAGKGSAQDQVARVGMPQGPAQSPLDNTSEAVQILTRKCQQKRRPIPKAACSTHPYDSQQYANRERIEKWVQEVAEAGARCRGSDDDHSS